MNIIKDHHTQNKDIVSIFIITGIILLIPLVAMQFTNEVKWALSDFVTMGALLAGTGFLLVQASRKIKSTKHRAVTITVVLTALFLIWAELSVGIFGSPLAGS